MSEFERLYERVECGEHIYLNRYETGVIIPMNDFGLDALQIMVAKQVGAEAFKPLIAKYGYTEKQLFEIFELIARKWQNVGFFDEVRPINNPPPRPGPEGTGLDKCYRLNGGKIIRVAFDHPEMGLMIDDLLCDYSCDLPPDYTIMGMEENNFLSVEGPGVKKYYRQFPHFAWKNILSDMQNILLMPDEPTMQLHASAVEIGGKIVLLAGGDNAGKSTLAALLSDKGSAVFGDELINMTPTGKIANLPAGLIIKVSRWPIFEETNIDIATYPVRQAVRRLNAELQRIFLNTRQGRYDERQSAQISEILIVRYKEGSPTFFDEVDGTEAFNKLILAETRAIAGANIFEAVKHLSGVNCRTLTYSNYHDAVTQVIKTYTD